MGATNYDETVHTARSATAYRTGRSMMSYDEDVRTGRTAAVINGDVDPKFINSAGQLIRESRDSSAHPNSNAVAVLFDGTGSMGKVPRIFIEKLAKLMGAILKNGYLPDPQLLFGVVGDAKGDKFPLQVGQFESGNEMDESLSKFILEGNGQSNYHESYDLALYFLARYASMDCYEKRGRKGYLFILGDEKVQPFVSREEVESVIGEPLQADMPLENLLEELRARFHVFWIFPNGTNYWGTRGEQLGIHKQLTELFGQQLLWLEDASAVCELIVSTIAVNEGYDLNDVNKALNDVGFSERSQKAVSKALVPFNNFSLTKKGKVSGTLVTKGEDKVARL